MKNKIIAGTAFFAILFPIIAIAAATPDPTAVTIIQGALKASTDTIFKDLQTWGISLLGALISAQFVLTNFNLLKNGTEIDGFVSRIQVRSATTEGCLV